MTASCSLGRCRPTWSVTPCMGWWAPQPLGRVVLWYVKMDSTQFDWLEHAILLVRKWVKISSRCFMRKKLKQVITHGACAHSKVKPRS